MRLLSALSCDSEPSLSAGVGAFLVALILATLPPSVRAAGGSSVNYYVTGDVVMQNPKETATILAVLVICAALLVVVIHYFQHHRSLYIRDMFRIICQEVLIDGLLGLVVVFISSTFQGVFPDRWIALFGWLNTVLFAMLGLMLGSMILSAVGVEVLTRRLKRIELSRSVGAHSSSPPTSPKNASQRSTSPAVPPALDQFAFNSHPHQRPTFNLEGWYDCLNILFVTHIRERVRSQSDLKKFLPPFEMTLANSRLGHYMEKRIRYRLIKHLHVTWYLWLTLAPAAGINSLRLFVLPGKLQSKDNEDFTTDDRVSNYVSFVCMSYIPLLWYIGSLCYLQRKVSAYVVDEVRLACAATMSTTTTQSASTPVAISDNGAAEMKDMSEPLVDGAVAGRSLSDPKVYLHRRSTAVTVYFLYMPMVLSEFYLAMFIMGVAGELTRSIGWYAAFVVAAQLLPLVLVVASTPFAVMLQSVLLSFGTRTNMEVVGVLYKKVLSAGGGNGKLKMDSTAMEASDGRQGRNGGKERRDGDADSVEMVESEREPTPIDFDDRNDPLYGL